MSLPTVAVVGRPNVGKSTLVNRIIGRRQAIVDEQPGVTRDRVLYPADWAGKPFLVVDTGGFEEDPEDAMGGRISEIATQAAAESDVVVLVVDARAGLLPADRAVAEVLRRLERPVVVAANKVDDRSHEALAGEFYELGLGEVMAISALHGRGTGDLLDAATKRFAVSEEETVEGEPAVAIVGRPNVGKSTLFNRLAGAQHSLVDPEPGTTRDAIDTLVEMEGWRYRFVDTAGLRRASRVHEPTEYYSTVRTLRALERADAALFMIDASAPVARQDLRIATEIVEAGRSAVVVLNKIDAVPAPDREDRRAELARRLPHLEFAPLVEVSAKTGRSVAKIWPALATVLDARSVRAPTPLLNAVVQDLQGRSPIPGGRIKYAVQAETSPPTVVLFGSADVPVGWLRYLERGLRRRFGFEGTPIRFVTRKGSDRRTG